MYRHRRMRQETDPRDGGRRSTSWDPQEWGEAEHIMGPQGWGEAEHIMRSPGMGGGVAHHEIPRNGGRNIGFLRWTKKINKYTGSKRPPGVRAYLNTGNTDSIKLCTLYQYGIMLIYTFLHEQMLHCIALCVASTTTHCIVCSINNNKTLHCM